MRFPPVRAESNGQSFILDSITFELIKGEMAYVNDLENIEYVRRKRTTRFSY